MLSTKIPSCRHELQLKIAKSSLFSRRSNGRFTKRIHGLQGFIPKAHLRDTYLAMQESMNLETRVSFTGNRELAERRGVDVRTLQRHLAALERLGVIVRTLRKYAQHSNHTNRYTFPLLNEDFLMGRLVSGGGDIRVTVKPLPEIEKQATTPRAPTARRSCHEWKPDREAKPAPPRQRGDDERFTHWMRWREHCMARRLEDQARANIGRNFQPQDPVSEEQLAEMAAFRERERQREREREEARKAEVERMRLANEARARQREEEIREPWSAEERARMDALLQRCGVRR
jgi:hypothetical protein